MTARVLIVDDEPLIARLYCRAAALAGYAPVAAAGGEEALAMIREEAPALLLTDLNMPDLGGDALASRIYESGLKSFPILLMTADDTPALIAAGVRAGVDDFLVKGMSLVRFSERIGYWVRALYPGVPPHVRRDAQKSLARTPPPYPPIARMHSDLGWMTGRAAMVVEDLLSAAPPAFAAGESAPVRLLGAVDGILALLARENGLAQLRRAEAMQTVVAAISAPWPQRLTPLLRDLHRLADDPVYRGAARSLRLDR